MNQSRIILSSVCLILWTPALQPQTTNPLTAIVTERFNDLRMNLEESAGLMPEDKYGFRLTEGQRTFGEWIGHTAQSCYNFCSVIRGEKPPEAAQHAHHGKTKAELSRALREALAYCSEGLKDMSDQKALAPAGANNVPPVRGMVTLVSSINSHYGNMVGYLRVNNIVPPSTARAQKQQKGH